MHIICERRDLIFIFFVCVCEINSCVRYEKDWTGTNSWISLFLFWSERKNFHTPNNVYLLYFKLFSRFLCIGIYKGKWKGFCNINLWKNWKRIFLYTSIYELCAVFVKNRISHYIYRKNCTKDNKPFSDKAHNLINDSRGAPFLFLLYVLFSRCLSIHFHRMFLSPLNSFRTQLQKSNNNKNMIWYIFTFALYVHVHEYCVCVCCDKNNKAKIFQRSIS